MIWMALLFWLAISLDELWAWFVFFVYCMVAF